MGRSGQFRQMERMISHLSANNSGLVITEAGEEVVELEIDPTTRKGYTMIPHGFGLVHQGKVFGANANRIASNTHRDPIAGTPLHRYIPCRVQAYVEDSGA